MAEMKDSLVNTINESMTETNEVAIRIHGR